MPISPPPDTTPAPELGFAQVREDPGCELAVVRRVAAELGRPLRTLVVASGGCTALALLARPEVASVDAVDPNPAQLHLVALRAAAATRLDAAAQLALLGADPSHDPARAALLYGQLRPHLAPATRAWWDARPAQLAYGLNRAGRFETLFRELAAEFAARGLDPVERPGEALVSPDWHPAFQKVFRRERLAELLGERAVMYSTGRPFADHFAEAFAGALQRFDPATNPFMHQAFRDAYPAGGAGLPAYLGREACEALRRRGTQDLRLHEGTLEAMLGPLTAAAPYDLVHTSYITDWMPRQDARALFARLAGALAPGGAVVARRLNGDYVLADELAPYLPVDAELSASLLRGDRSFFYQEVVAAFAPPRP
jgi:S-adenosylmethionine-diacylglycerol 3-amino-3-carboxypropyl transferase